MNQQGRRWQDAELAGLPGGALACSCFPLSSPLFRTRSFLTEDDIVTLVGRTQDNTASARGAATGQGVSSFSFSSSFFFFFFPFPSFDWGGALIEGLVLGGFVDAHVLRGGFVTVWFSDSVGPYILSSFSSPPFLFPLSRERRVREKTPARALR